MDVYSGGKNIAELCPVTADAAYGNDDDLPQVTRPERAGGENTFMDHPENVTDPSTWKPPAHKVKVPRSRSDAQRRRFPDGHGEEHPLSSRLLFGG